MFYIIGLGNPGEEYENSRHNTGKSAVEFFASHFAEASRDKKKNTSKKIKIIESGEFMNHSGKAIAKFIKSKKAAQNLIVIHDDIDLPLGALKISYNKGSGGHKGLESVVKAVKTKEFVRIRIGISPTTPKGKLKKPRGEKAVIDFILNKFKPAEMDIMKKTFKKVSEAIQTLVSEGHDKAMNLYN